MDAIFPIQINPWFKAAKAADWNPEISRSVSGKRRSFLFYQQPIVELTLPIGHMYQVSEMELLYGFYNAMRGAHRPFYFFDVMNIQNDVVLGTGDGFTTSFQLFRPWGDADLYVEYPKYPPSWVAGSGYGLDGWLTPEITGYGVPVPPTPDIYHNDVLQTDYSLTADGKIVFDTAPAVGVEVKASNFYFCYHVAFSEKNNPKWIIEFYNGWSTSLTLETVNQ